MSGFAFWRGERPERLGASAFIVASLVSPLVHSHNWFDPDWGVMAVDVILLAALVWMALAYDRAWLLFAAAFQLLGVAIHLAIVADHGVRPMPYRQGLVIWSYMTLVALAAGTLRVWRDQAGEGAAARR